MILNILVLIKTVLYMSLTQIEVNRILVVLVSYLISKTILELLRIRSENHGGRLIFYSLFSIVLFADSMYFAQFNTLPSVELVKQIGLLSAVGDSVVDLLSLKHLVFLIDLPFLLIIYIKNKKKRKRNIYSRKRPKGSKNYRYVIPILLVTLALSFYTGNFDSLASQEPYIYHIKDIYESLASKEVKSYGRSLDRADIEDLVGRARLEEGKLTGLGKDKNLIVVQVEALQDFVIGLEYEGIEITPELNKLIADQSTIYYDQYYQLVGRGNTSDAEFVSNNSLHPAMDEPTYSKFGDEEFYGLPQVLRDQGYRTIAMHGYEGEFWNRRTAYKGQGFDEFKDMSFYEDYEKIGLGVSDRDFFIQSVDYLKKIREEKDQPFYSFMISLTSHTPFDMPEEHKAFELREEHKDTMLGRYLQSIHYTDRQLGLLVEELKEAGLYEDTVLAIYGDHFAVSAAKEDEREVMTDFLGYPYELDEMMHIPLIIHLPGEEVGGVNSKVGSQLDFFPTILNIMGYENKKGMIFGRDLNNYEGENFVAPQTYMAKGSIIEEDRVFVISRDGIFENSRAYDKKTKEPIEIEGFREIYQKAIEEINLSDYIMNSGLFRKYLETGEIQIQEGEGEEIKTIYPLEENSLEGLEKASKKGKYIGVEVEKLDDEILIGGEGGLGLDEALLWKEGKDLTLVLRAGGPDEEAILSQAYDKYELGDSIAEISSFEPYLNLSFNRYDKLIIRHDGRYDDKEMLDFLGRNPDLGIALENKSEIRDEFLSKDIYIHK